MKKPLILVTNDDGMFAPGLKALVQAVKEFGEVVVVAPDSPQSAKGHAITVADPLRLNQVDIFENILAYECSGTPVDCVKLAKHVLLKDRKFDLCVSGINHGSNASINIIYSGTLSAAMEASLEGCHSIGFSLMDFSFDADFTPCLPYVQRLVLAALRVPPSEPLFLNVNFPKLPADQIRGIRVCRQAEARWVEEFQEAEDPRKQKYYWLTGRFIVLDEGDDTDVYALQNGYVSVVPCMHDLTDYKALPQIGFLENI